MEISNLSSAWWLIAIVVLVITTRVVLYYRAKAKRKDELSRAVKSLKDNPEKHVYDNWMSCISKPHVAPSGKIQDFTPPKPKLIDKARKSFEERKDSPEKRKQFLVVAGILDESGGYAEHFKQIKTKQVVNKSSDDYNANSMYVLSNSYATSNSSSCDISSGSSSSSSSSSSSCD